LLLLKNNLPNGADNVKTIWMGQCRTINKYQSGSVVAINYDLQVIKTFLASNPQQGFEIK